ncbi:MAG TPA: cellulase family glycosylhydrolase [Mycobacterium sp.]|nr:cellulase family glycosylhydrolase [Mycobacterium sp.]
MQEVDVILGVGGDGGDAGNSGIGGPATGLPALGGAGGNPGSLGSHGAVGRSGTGGVGSWTDVTEGADASLLTITPNGTWLTTPDGRVVILHGANEVYKVDSYAPADAGFDADDAEFLAANGFNVVRLGMIWAAVEPEPGVFDHDYLASIAQTVQVLAAHGVYTLLDMHQDNYSTVFGGEGAPVWATQTGGLPNVDYGFPWNYFLNAAEGHAWDAFWSNAETPTGLGLEDEYARTWETVASYFTGNPAVIGYDVMNEPFEGSGWPAALLGGTFFAEQQLAPMYNQVIAAIRAVDPTTAIFVEPTPATYELGALLGRPLVLGTIDDPNVVAAVHNYCYGSATTGICSWIADTVAAKAQAYSVQHQIPVFMGEFGASDITTDLTAGMNAANRYFTSWTVWSYSGKGDITTAGPTEGESLVYDPALPPSDANVNTSNLVTLAAPYPQFISGTPNAWSFTGGTLKFSYSTEKVDGSGSFDAGSQTVISVPAVEYPNGYQVNVTGGHVVSAPGARLLVIASDPGATTISVVVSGAAVISDLTGEAV